MIPRILSMFRPRDDVSSSWDDWRAAGDVAQGISGAFYGDKPDPMDFGRLQEQLAEELASQGHYTADGALVLHLELDADLVADIDKLRARFNFDNRTQVLQRGVELLKLLSTRSTYNAHTPAKIRHR